MKIAQVIERLSSSTNTEELADAIQDAIKILIRCEGRSPELELPAKEDTWYIIRNKGGHHHEVMWKDGKFCDMGFTLDSNGLKEWKVWEKWPIDDVDHWWPLPIVGEVDEA